MNLTQDIQNLLYTEPCVIIPGFGGFVSHPKSSEIDLISKTVKPVSNKLAFNAALKTNDGILANYIKNRYNITFNEAILQIEKFVSEIETTLNEKRNADLQGIGSFYLNSDNQILFIPHHNLLYNKVSYGLPTLRLKEKQEVQESKSTIPTTPKEEKIVFQPTFDKEKQRKKKETFEPIHENKISTKKTKTRFVKVINSVGFVIILLLVGAVIFNEVSPSSYESVNLASIIDTPQDNSTKNQELSEKRANVYQLLQEYAERQKKSTFKIQINATFTQTEASQIKEELMFKFKNIQLNSENNNDYNITLIEFENELLANDYIKLVQPRIKYPLTINK